MVSLILLVYFILLSMSLSPTLSPTLWFSFSSQHPALNQKIPLLQLPADKIPLCWIFKEQSGKPQTHVIFASLRWTRVLTVASPFSSSSKRVAESACSWKGFPCISFFQTYRNMVYTAFWKANRKEWLQFETASQTYYLIIHPPSPWSVYVCRCCPSVTGSKIADPVIPGKQWLL